MRKTGSLIFFATDVHGSERCFKKFLRAADAYGAGTLILGGDITGKWLAPILAQSDGTWKARFLERDWVARSTGELEELKARVSASGYYPYLTDARGLAELERDPERLEDVFLQLMLESVRGWLLAAREILGGTGVKCFVSPGNDDRPEIDALLRESEGAEGRGGVVSNPDGTKVWLDEDHEMISLGWGNPTPWNCPRDLSEEELGARIDRLAATVERMDNCVFNFHIPPYDTVIDQAPKLDDNLRPRLQPGGGLEMAPAGSIAVRRAIEKYQPLLGLHGHIHESKGFCRIGRTLCVNPGSEYTEGILKGFLFKLGRGKVDQYLFTSG